MCVCVCVCVFNLILSITFLNELDLFFLHTVKLFQVLLNNNPNFTHRSDPIRSYHSESECPWEQ